jgi:hypothetical protein
MESMKSCLMLKFAGVADIEKRNIDCPFSFFKHMTLDSAYDNRIDFLC